MVKIWWVLVLGGMFIFDVYLKVVFEGVKEGVFFEWNFMNGFWLFNDYFVF